MTFSFLTGCDRILLTVNKKTLWSQHNKHSTVLQCRQKENDFCRLGCDTYCKKWGMGLLPKFSWDPIIMGKNIQIQFKIFFFHPFQQWQNLSLSRALPLEFWFKMVICVSFTFNKKKPSHTLTCRIQAQGGIIAKGGHIYSNDDVIIPKNFMQIEIF